MKPLDEVFTEEQVNEVSGKILASVKKRFTNELISEFYDRMQEYLYEHYDNISDSIHEKLIKEIADEFISDPKDYRFSALRKKLFNENKEVLTSILTDEMIFENINAIVWGHLGNGYQFSWKWSDAIVRIIRENLETLMEDNRINQGLVHEIYCLKQHVARLQQQLQEKEYTDY